MSSDLDYLPYKSGTYIIKHVPSGYFYIGSTNNIRKRITDHRYELNRNNHYNYNLNSIYNNWADMEVVYWLFEKEEDYRNEEQRLLNLYHGTPCCCNIGTGAINIWSHGKPIEVQERTSEKRRGVRLTEEHCMKMRERMLGKKASEETKKKMSATHKGKLFSEETRLKLSIANKGKIRGPLPEDVRIRKEFKRKETIEANGGFKMSEPSKQKIADYNKKKVIISGNIYASLQEAAVVYNVSQTTITNRINSNSEKYKEYSFL